jgi:sugar phosphate isomerase/epimerase
MKFMLKGINHIMQLVTRRSILKRGLTITAAATASAGVPHSLWGKPLVTVPGIQLYTVDKELKADPEGTLKKIRMIGYQEVETAGFGGLSAKAFRFALENAGLKCSSSHFFDFGSAAPGPLFEAANTLGVRYTVTSAMGRFTDKPAGQATGAEDYKAMAEFCNELGRKSKQAGLQLAYHNHKTEFEDLGQGKCGYDIFLEQTDANLVKLELDCGWMVAGGHSPVEYFRRYPDRYRMVHIKDFVKPAKPSASLESKDAPQGTVLGTGYIDYRPILKAAQAAGVEHFYVEQEPPFIGTTAIEAATMDYQYLESISN